jgi:hypothetical protein
MDWLSWRERLRIKEDSPKMNLGAGLVLALCDRIRLGTTIFGGVCCRGYLTYVFFELQTTNPSQTTAS